MPFIQKDNDDISQPVTEIGVFNKKGIKCVEDSRSVKRNEKEYCKNPQPV